MNTDIFSKRLKILTEKSGKTQRQICSDAGIATASYARFLSNSCVPDVSNLYNISKYFGVSIDWLLGYEPANPTISTEANELASLYDTIDEADKIIIKAVLAKYKP